MYVCVVNIYIYISMYVYSVYSEYMYIVNIYIYIYIHPLLQKYFRKPFKVKSTL